MAFNTKLRFSDSKFYQCSGDVMALSGTTCVGALSYLTAPSITTDLQITGKKYVDDQDTAVSATTYACSSAYADACDAVVSASTLTAASNYADGCDAAVSATTYACSSSYADACDAAVSATTYACSSSYADACDAVVSASTLSYANAYTDTCATALCGYADGCDAVVSASTLTAASNYADGCDAAVSAATYQCSTDYTDTCVASCTITASNGLTKSGVDIHLGGSLTGDTQITGSYLLAANVTTLNLTGVSTNLGGIPYLKGTITGSGGLLCIDGTSGQVCQTSLSAFGGITGATNGLTDCGNQQLGFGGSLCANTIVNGAYSMTFGDLQGVCLSTSGTTDIGLNAKTNGGVYLKSQSGTVAGTDFTNAVGILADFNAGSGLAVYDNRAGSNQTGIIYAADYTTNFVDRSLVDKAYVDAVAAGLDPKSAVLVATTANITLSGTQTIDGVGVVAGDRVLVKDQTSGSTNGIYVVTGGTWSRSTDFDGTPVGEVTEGALIPVLSGDTNINSSWILITKDPITVGTTVLEFTKFSQLLDIAAGAGIAIGTVGQTQTICVSLGSNSGLNTSSGLVVDSSIGGIGLTLTSGVLNVNAESCGSVGAIPVGYNTGECLVVACSDIATALGTPINSANNGLRKTGTNVVLGGPLTGATTISSAGATSLSFTDTRATTCGIEYTGDYRSGFQDNTLITKCYADSCDAVVSGATFACSSAYADACDAVVSASTLSYANNYTDTCATALCGYADGCDAVVSASTLTAASNYADGCDAVVSAATYQCSTDYTDNCYASTITSANNGLTKSGANVRLGGDLTGNTTIEITGNTLTISNDSNEMFEINGGVCTVDIFTSLAYIGVDTDQIQMGSTNGNIIIDTNSVEIGSSTAFVCVDGATNQVCQSGTVRLMTTPVDDTDGAILVWDSVTKNIGKTSISSLDVTANNGLSANDNNVTLGGALTGNTSLTGAYNLGFTHTNFNVTAAVCITGAMDTNSTLGVGGVVTLDTVNAGDIATDSVLVLDSSGIVKKVDGDTLGEDNNRYNIDVVTGNTTLPTTGYTILVSGATSLTLPAGVNGMAYKIKDACGNALAAPITVVGTIDGSANALINTDYGALELAYSSTLVEWYSLAFIN